MYQLALLTHIRNLELWITGGEPYDPVHEIQTPHIPIEPKGKVLFRWELDEKTGKLTIY